MGCKPSFNSGYKHAPKLMLDHLDYTSIYNQSTSLYLIARRGSEMKLFIYDTESNSEEAMTWESQDLLGDYACSIVQLPNHKLFCFGNYPASGLTLIIDENGAIQFLSSRAPIKFSSAIYFNRNVYCFGGESQNNNQLNLSRRFNLNVNRWFDLPQMPYADSYCNSVIFNGNILISGITNKNLLLYSVYVNSFTKIPHEFAENKRKILINAKKRLYLIESMDGSIYESEIGSYIFWVLIAKSTIDFTPYQAYSLYNKGKIYIGCIDSRYPRYFKLNLKRKRRGLELFYPN